MPALLGDVEKRADVRMAQCRDRAGFALEPRAPIGAFVLVRWQQLKGDGSIEPSIERLVDLTHPADANERQDLVGAKP
jgi:hypothetical protein